MTHRNKAIVMGASMTGLLAARVLSDFFQEIVVVERDQLPDEITYRQGVPQAKHVHILLSRGEQIITGLFPNLAHELDNVGATQFDVARDSHAIIQGQRMPDVQTGIMARSVSRVVLEGYVRRNVEKLSNVTFLPQAEVTNLLTNDTRDRVTGVQLRYRGDGQGPDKMMADLVVDATGRNTHTPKWLKSLEIGDVYTSRVNAFLGYATQLFEPPADYEQTWQAFATSADPPNKTRGGAITCLEDGTWMVTVVGMSKDYPSTDANEFLAFARDVHPDFYAVVASGKPISEVSGYRRMENVWHHYEQLPRWLNGFIVMGDAVCGFNPVYGQGMTVAAMDAQVLQTQLQSGSFTPQTYQKTIAKQNKEPIWLIATSEDWRWPLTEGEPPNFMTRIMHKYMDRMVQLLPYDTDIAIDFLRVQHLLAPSTLLLQPKMIWRVLTHKS